MCRRLALAVSLALAVPIGAQAEDLLDVFRQARRADPVLAAADAARGVQQEGVAQARAPLLPQLSATAQLDQTSNPGLVATDPGRNRSRDVSASLSQTVVNLSQLAQLDAARSRADSQNEAYRSAEQALVVRVAAAYFNVLTAADSLANVQANEDAYRQQVEQADQRYRNGLSALVDVDQARAYQASAQASTLSAKTALADAREALTQLTGLPAGDLKPLRDDLPMTPPQPADAQIWVQTALANNPAITSQRYGVTAAERAIAAARASHLPTLSASAGFGRFGSWPIPTSYADGRNVTTYGLVLNVPLFSGGLIQSQVRQSVHERDAANDQLEIQRRAVARDTLDQYRKVVSGIEQITVAKAGVQSATRALAATRVGQQLGTQTMTDLLLAIQTLTGAQQNYSAVRHDFILAKLLLQQDAGAVDERDLAAVNSLLQ